MTVDRTRDSAWRAALSTRWRTTRATSDGRAAARPASTLAGVDRDAAAACHLAHHDLFDVGDGRASPSSSGDMARARLPGSLVVPGEREQIGHQTLRDGSSRRARCERPTPSRPGSGWASADLGLGADDGQRAAAVRATRRRRTVAGHRRRRRAGRACRSSCAPDGRSRRASTGSARARPCRRADRLDPFGDRADRPEHPPGEQPGGADRQQRERARLRSTAIARCRRRSRLTLASCSAGVPRCSRRRP